MKASPLIPPKNQVSQGIKKPICKKINRISKSSILKGLQCPKAFRNRIAGAGSTLSAMAVTIVVNDMR